MHLCTFFLMKSYGQRCIRMPPLRGGQSLVHLCLTAIIERRCAAHHPSGTGRSVGYKTRIGRWQTSRFALASPQIDSRSPADGGLRARYASGEMLASLALAPPPLATFVPVQVALMGHQKSVPGSAGYKSVADVAPRRTSLAPLASLVQIPSVDPKQNVCVAPRPIYSTVLGDVMTPSPPAT